MEIKKKSGILIALALILVMAFVFAAIRYSSSRQAVSDDLNKESPALTLKSDEEEGIMHVTEVSPLFPGCDSVVDAEALKSCSENKLLHYLYGKIKYPEYALQHGIEGRCVITFVVEKDGKISHAKILKDIGGGCGEEALRVVHSMNELPQPWIPGKHKGQIVRVRFNLPVKFQLATKTVN